MPVSPTPAGIAFIFLVIMVPTLQLSLLWLLTMSSNVTSTCTAMTLEWCRNYREKITRCFAWGENCNSKDDCRDWIWKIRQE
jgi:hypothetical protein